MANYGGLVHLLRATKTRLIGGHEKRFLVNPDGLAAATAIETLRAEVERTKYDGIHTCHDNCQRTACVLRRENEALRAEVEALKLQDAASSVTIADLAGHRDDLLSELAATLQKLAEETNGRAAVQASLEVVVSDCEATLQKLADLQTGYQATAEAAATHLKASMDAKAKLVKAREGLEKAQRQFRFYADEHDAKAKAAKEAVDDALYWGNVAEQEAAGAEWRKRTKQAKTNHDFATMLAETLAQVGEVDGGNNSG